MPELAELDDIASAKRALRGRMKRLRSALPEAAHLLRSERVVQNLLELREIRGAAAVALFAPMLQKREVDLRPLDTTLRREGKRLYYPFMAPRNDGGYVTGFREVVSTTELVERGRGFAEPDPTRPAAARGEIDVVIVPALAVDPRGHRLGYGGGIYDATLPDVCPPAATVVVAFDFQLLIELPVGEGDFPCGTVVTDCRVLRCAESETPTKGDAR